MSRACSPGGRFTADFETDSLLSGVDADLKKPVGTIAQWWVWDPINTGIDPIYDVGSIEVGRRWRGPYNLPVVRAVISQGQVPTSEFGYYNADTLHLTLNAEDVEKIAPGVVANPDYQNRGRIIWKNEVFRPTYVQQRGIVGERFTLIVVDCIQVMPEELVNDQQFLDKASPPPPSGVPHIINLVDGGEPTTVDFSSILDSNDNC